MVKFERIHEDVVAVLKANNIKEDALFNHYSDLYIGCKDYKTAQKIKKAGVWNAMSSVFTPQKDSGMDEYICAVDIAFAHIGYLQDKLDKVSKS